MSSILVSGMIVVQRREAPPAHNRHTLIAAMCSRWQEWNLSQTGTGRENPQTFGRDQTALHSRQPVGMKVETDYKGSASIVRGAPLKAWKLLMQRVSQGVQPHTFRSPPRRRGSIPCSTFTSDPVQPITWKRKQCDWLSGAIRGIGLKPCSTYYSCAWYVISCREELG